MAVDIRGGMMRRRDRWAVKAVAVLLTLVCAFPAYATKTELGDAKKKVSSIEEEKKKVEAALKNLESLKSDTAAYVSSLDENMAALSAELEQLDEAIFSSRLLT